VQVRAYLSVRECEGVIVGGCECESDIVGVCWRCVREYCECVCVS